MRPVRPGCISDHPDARGFRDRVPGLLELRETLT